MEWGWRGVKEKNGNVDRSGTQDGDSSTTTPVSTKKNDRGTKDSSDAMKTQSDENINGPTANGVVANVTILPKDLIPSGPTSYAKLVIGITSKKSVNFRTLVTPKRNEAEVVFPFESIRAISERFVNTAYGFFLGKRVAYPVVANYFSSMDGLDSMLENGPWFIRNSLLILKKWNPDVNLIKEDVGGRSSYVRALIEIRADVELKDTIVVAMPKLIGEGFCTCTIRVECEWKPPKNPSQAPRGVPVGPNVGFKLAKQVYRTVKKTNANTSGNKKKDVESTKEGEGNSSGSSFWNVRTSSTSTTPIVEKIDKIEKLIINGKCTIVDDEGKLLKKFVSTFDYDSEDEFESLDTKWQVFSLQRRIAMEIPDNIHSICDNFDINVRGRLPKKAATPQVLVIQGGRFQKPDKKPQATKGKGKGKSKGKSKLAYALKPKNPSPAKKEYMTKDATCYHCKKLTPPYTPQHSGVCKRRNHILHDMVRLMMNLTTMPLSFWDYARESATRILNMVQTEKDDKTPYKLWYGKVPNLSYLKVWGCKALMKRDTLDKFQQRSVKCIFVGCPKETIVSSGSVVKLEEIQDEDTSPSKNTSQHLVEAKSLKPQIDVALIRRSKKTHRAPNRLCLNVEVEEYSLEDINEPTNYKVALLNPEFDKLIDAMNA
nr:hypothetical protein [Tanacetum cinerariifolium]